MSFFILLKASSFRKLRVLPGVSGRALSRSDTGHAITGRAGLAKQVAPAPVSPSRSRLELVCAQGAPEGLTIPVQLYSDTSAIPTWIPVQPYRDTSATLQGYQYNNTRIPVQHYRDISAVQHYRDTSATIQGCQCNTTGMPVQHYRDTSEIL